MLSPESQTVYDILCAITGGSEVYKIVDADEITDKLPSAVSLNKVQLSQVIRDLKERELVDVKYFTPDEYCLHIIKRIAEAEPAREAEDGESAEEKKERVPYGGKKKKEVAGIKRGMVFFMSFLGCLFGSGIVSAIAILVVKFAL